MPERWARAAGFPAYEVSTSGRVRQYWTKRMLGASNNSDGYPYVHLVAAGARYTKAVHLVVWRTFRGPVPAGHEVDHRDHRRGNPRLSNLQCLTKSRNRARRLETRGGSSRYRGVAWQPERQRWFASVTVNRKTQFLGRFVSEREAALAYDRAARRLFGDCAVPNFGRKKHA